jgi:hypothetical protein
VAAEFKQRNDAGAASIIRGVPLETTIVPRPPYSLALSLWMRSDTTRRLQDNS